VVEIDGKHYPTLTDIRDAISKDETGPGNFVGDSPGIFLVGEVSSRTSSTGSEFYDGVVRDRNGETRVKIWSWKERPVAGLVVFADYKHDPRYGLSLEILGGKPLSSIAEELLAELVPSADIDTQKKLLEGLIAGVSSEPLSRLLCKLFDSQGSIYESFCKAPAASSYHHVRIGGLVEHSVNVARLCLKVCELDFAKLADKDLLVAGALIHDIGKIWSYSYDDASFDITTKGALEDHMAIGVKILASSIAEIGEFPQYYEEQLTHMIVSHHGMKEWGATVVPKTLEAMILHNCDRLDAKVEEFNQAIVQTPQGEQWSEYHRILGTRVYVARRPEDEPLQQEET